MRNSPPNVLDVCIGSPSMRGPLVHAETPRKPQVQLAPPHPEPVAPSPIDLQVGFVCGKGGFIETSADLSQTHSLPNVLEGCILTQFLTSFLCYQHAC